MYRSRLWLTIPCSYMACFTEKYNSALLAYAHIHTHTYSLSLSLSLIRPLFIYIYIYMDNVLISRWKPRIVNSSNISLLSMWSSKPSPTPIAYSPNRSTRATRVTRVIRVIKLGDCNSSSRVYQGYHIRAVYSVLLWLLLLLFLN